MPRASLVSLVAASALLQTLVSAGDGDDSYFGGGLALPGSGSGDGEEAKEPKEAKAIVAPEDAYAYGPKNCVKTWLHGTRCMMQTDCKEEDIKDYVFHLVCVDRGGEKSRHVFGPNSFEPQETFDTLVTCKICTGDKVVDTQLTAKQVTDQPQDTRAALEELAGAVREMKEEMQDATVEIKKLNAKVFAEGEGAPVPEEAKAPEEEAEAPEEAEVQPAHFMAKPARHRQDPLPKSSLKRFLEHRRASDAMRARSWHAREAVAAEADSFHRRAMMHRAAAAMKVKIGGERQAHASKLQRVERSAEQRSREQAQHEREAVATVSETSAEAKKSEEKRRSHRAAVQEEAESTASSEDDSEAGQGEDAQAESEQGAEAESEQGAEAHAESEQGADAQEGEASADDAAQEDAEQQESGAEARDTEENQEAQADEAQDSEEAQSQDDAAQQEEQGGEQAEEESAQEEDTAQA